MREKQTTTGAKMDIYRWNKVWNSQFFWRNQKILIKDVICEVSLNKSLIKYVEGHLRQM